MVKLFSKGDDTVTEVIRLSKELKQAEAQRDKLVAQRADAQREADKAHEAQKALSPDADVSAFTNANERVSKARNKATAFDVHISELDRNIVELWTKLEAAQAAKKREESAHRIAAANFKIAEDLDAATDALRRLLADLGEGEGWLVDSTRDQVRSYANEIVRTVKYLLQQGELKAEALKNGTDATPVVKQEPAPAWPPANARQATITLPTGVGYQVPAGAFSAGA